MTLSDWITKADTTRAAVAKEIGVSEVAVCRYCTGKRLPKRDVAVRLRALTDGLVTLDDFIAVPDDLASKAVHASNT